MIEIFNPGNDRFDLNGDVVLLPTLCDIDVSLDSVWSLELNHPIDKEGRWKSIVNNAVLQVTSFKLTSNERQLYRIRKVDVSDSGVKALAQPIWMDAQNEVFLVDVRPKNKTGQEALDSILKSNSKYKGSSNIVKKSTAYYILKNAAEAIMGSDNSFLERWGGEVLYDNYTIIVNDKIGDDYGFEVVYGKNLLVDGLKETIEIDDVVTRIVPKSFNGYTLAGTSPWVDSPLINSYPTIRTKVMEFPNIKLEVDVNEGDESDDLVICPTIAVLRTKLAEAARAEFNKGIDKPKVTIQCKLAALEKTEEYKQYKDLFKLGLGDTVHCRHNKLGIVTDARVRSVKWDCIKECIKDITIGDEYRSFVERVSSSIGATEKALTKAGSVKASRVSGTVDMGVAQLKYQKNIAQKQNVRAILFEDLDPDSKTYGAMCLGSLGFEIANTRTPDDRDWVWTTFGTAQGFTANLINAGTLKAINIEGSYIKGGTVEGTLVKGSTIDGNTIKGGVINGTEINGGIIKGGEINGTKIIGGIIEGNTINGSIVSSEGEYEIDSIKYIDKASFKDGRFIQTTNVVDAGSLGNLSIYNSSIFINSSQGKSEWHWRMLGFEEGRYISQISSRGLLIGSYASSYQVGAFSALTYDNSSTPPRLDVVNQDSNPIEYVEFWNRYFKYDPEVSLTAYPIYAGHITNSSKSLDFFIPLPKRCNSVTPSVSFTRLSVRKGDGGYVGGSQYINIDNTYTISCTPCYNGLYVRVTKSTAYTNVTANNQVVTVQGAIKINFD